MYVTPFLLSWFLLSCAVGQETDTAAQQAAITEQQQHMEDDIELAIKGAEEARGKIDALRCYLLHAEEVKKGRVPEGWEQPPYEFYERVNRHPCSILPGFIDPMLEERKALEKKKADKKKEDKVESFLDPVRQ